MPKSITFFSRGKTPIYVNYVIAHNTHGDPYRKSAAFIRQRFFLYCKFKQILNFLKINK